MFMEDKKQMSVFGVGPMLAFITIDYAVIIYFVSSAYCSLFSISFLSRSVLDIAAITLLAFGLTLHVICAMTIVKIHKQDRLSTGGMYKMCRHPMYSVWIFFNFPAIALLFGSWLMLTVPVFMYIIFRILVRKEENYLKERYPQDYIEYKKNVNLVFPCLWKLAR